MRRGCCASIYWTATPRRLTSRAFPSLLIFRLAALSSVLNLQLEMSSITHVFTSPTPAAYRDWLALLFAIFLGYVSHTLNLARRMLTHTGIQLIARAVYDVFFHPLANYPGPFVAKISKMPSFYHAVKGDRHIWIWQNHQIYGLYHPYFS